MNFLKNLMIIAVLGAVGYGVYVSLARNNVEPSPPPGATASWPTVPQVEFPSTKATVPPGGSLAISANPPKPDATSGFSMGGPAPSFSSSPSTAPINTPPSAASALTPATPYPSSTIPSALPSNPMATLGTPTSPDTASSMAPPSAAASTSPSMTMPNTVATANPVAPPQSSLPSSDAVRNLAPPPASLGGPTAPPANPNDNLIQDKFASFMQAVQRKLNEGKLAEAHLALSALYGNADLPAEQAKQITDLLDQLAGSVIYSRQSYLEPAYRTQPGDTLDRIAQKYNIPWQLLARINGLMPPGATNADTATKDQPLPAGNELKVVRGPFEAVVRLDKHEITLMVQDRYAGRFAIGLGRDQPKLDGNYTVCNKMLSPPYYGADGVNINPNDPKNPLGSAWIGLTDRIGIHGAGSPQAIGRDDNRGTICVGDRDLQDLYGILTVGSRVTVLR